MFMQMDIINVAIAFSFNSEFFDDHKTKRFLFASDDLESAVEAFEHIFLKCHHRPGKSASKND